MKTLNPKIHVVEDYDNVFRSRVKEAVALNKSKGIKMFPNIVVNSGPYRPCCFAYERFIKQQTVKLDFYAANRVFGFQHSIKDICDVIKLS